MFIGKITESAPYLNRDVMNNLSYMSTWLYSSPRELNSSVEKLSGPLGFNSRGVEYNKLFITSWIK